MAKDKGQGESAVTPTKLPEVSPPQPQPGLDYSPHIFQSLMKLEGSLGGIEKTLEHLGGRVEKLEKKVERIDRWVIGATAIVGLVGAGGILILNKVADLLVDAIKSGWHFPHP